MTRSQNLLAFIAALGALVSIGCASSPAEGGCSALCLHQVTFTFANPPAGTSFKVQALPGISSTACRIDAESNANCESTGGGISRVSFEGNRLKSLIWAEPPLGNLQIRVTVDDSEIANQSFDYEPKSVRGPCSLCYEDPQFTVE